MKEAFAVRDSLTALLSAGAGGGFQVIQAGRKTDAGSILEKPCVFVEYASGEFPQNLSGVNGPYQHEASVTITIIAAAASEMDLGPIRDGGTQDEILAAFAGREDAYARADKLMEDAASLVFDLIMRPQNNNLGMDYIAERWITKFSKSPPSDEGDLVLRSGAFTLTYQVPEYTTEEEGVPGGMICHRMDLTADVNGEFTEGESARVTAPSNTGA